MIVVEQAHAWQKPPPVLLHDLHGTTRPSRPLSPEGQIVLRQQSPTIAAVGVVGTPPELQDRQSEVAILANRIARPAAGSVDCGPTDQAHRAVDNNSVHFVALDHADVEKARIFGVHGGMDRAAAAVTMILWRLDQSDFRVREARNQILEPMRINYIVCVDDTDNFGISRGLCERKPQRSSLESLEVLDANKLEAGTKLAAASLDRLPECRIGRVIDYHPTFEIRVAELRHRIDGSQQHFRRFPIGGNVNRNLWRARAHSRRRQMQQLRGLATKSDRRHLMHAEQYYRSEQTQQRKRNRKRDQFAMQEVVVVPVHLHA